VVSIALFGLAARNQMTEISEVDLLDEFAHPITYQRYFDAQFRLEDALGTTVDLVTKPSLTPGLRPFVETDAIQVY